MKKRNEAWSLKHRSLPFNLTANVESADFSFQSSRFRSKQHSNSRSVRLFSCSDPMQLSNVTLQSRKRWKRYMLSLLSPSDSRGSGKNPLPQCAFEMSMFNVSAIHINSRSWLRSSSTHEPSDPPLRMDIFASKSEKCVKV